MSYFDLSSKNQIVIDTMTIRIETSVNTHVLYATQVGAKMSLSQVVAKLIERRDKLTGDEKAKIAELVRHG